MTGGTDHPDSGERTRNSGKGRAGRSGKASHTRLRKRRRAKSNHGTGRKTGKPAKPRKVRSSGLKAKAQRRPRLVKRARLVKRERLVERSVLKLRLKRFPRRATAGRVGGKGAFTAGSFAAGLLWHAASLRATAQTAAAIAERDFKAARRQLTRSQAIVRQTVALLDQARREATRRPLRPMRPLTSSRAELWAWYRRRGLSWARFVADHGPG